MLLLRPVTTTKENVPNVPVPNCPAFGKINEPEGRYVEDY